MPQVPTEKHAKPILDKIRLCTDLLNYERYLRDCEAGARMCPKSVHDPLAGLPKVDLDVRCLRRSLVPIVFIIGAPGSGKGVQSELMVRRFGLTRISVGELLRSEVQAGSSVGRFVAATMADGKLVPTSVVLELLKRSMLTQLKGSRGFLIDGFPRDEGQMEAFEEEVARAHLVIFLEARDSTLLGRLVARGGGHAYEEYEEEVADRLAAFHRHTAVLKRAFGRRCRVVSAEGEVLSVFATITASMCRMLAQWGFESPYQQCPA